MTTAMEFAYDQKAFVNHSVGEILFLVHIKKTFIFLHWLSYNQKACIVFFNPKK
jgi:hypothetical protein